MSESSPTPPSSTAVCTTPNIYGLEADSISTLNSTVDYFIIQINESTTNTRLWTFTAVILPQTSQTKFRVTLHFNPECKLPSSKDKIELNQIRFNGSLSGILNYNNQSIALIGQRNPYVIPTWDHEKAIMTFDFHLPEYSESIYFMATWKDCSCFSSSCFVCCSCCCFGFTN